MKKIVLDCDGVILDYNHTWGKILSKFLNKQIDAKNIAFHASNVFDYHLADHEKNEFYELFHNHGWIDMQPIENSLKAIKLLEEKKFDIHIVTSIPEKANYLRKTNLTNLGVSFSSLHTVGYNANINSKKDIVNLINPDFFLDDLIMNFEGINEDINCILIDNNTYDNPNKIHEKYIQFYKKHNSLFEFVNSL